MFDYKKLTNAENQIYIKIPAKSRKQSFVVFQIKKDVQQNLQNMQNEFENIYLTLEKNNLCLIVIPFKHEIKSDELDHLKLEQLNEKTYSKLEYGHSYRDRSKNPKPFTLHNKEKELFNALQYTDDEEMYFNINKIKDALSKFVKTSEFKNIKDDDLKLRNLLHSLANDIYNKIYNQSDLDSILKILKQSIPNLNKQYSTAYDEINNNAGLRSRTEPFGKYLKLDNSGSKEIKNVTEQMLSMMSNDFEASHKLDLSIAGNLIAQVYPPYLIAQDGDDKDNVVMFDPIYGIWTHDLNQYRSLLMAIRPYSKESDLTTMLATFGAQARNKNAFIEPYNKSRHLLFKNCMLDTKTMIEYPLNSEETKKLHFTERTQININYDPEVTDAPEFPGKLKNKGGTWDPWTFFMAYANNNTKKLRFLFFCLSLGLFAGHNFGIHVDFIGESRWGKSTVSEIFKALFPHRVFTDVFAKLNEQFGFTNYSQKTSIIWLRECNEDTAPLNNEIGVPYYDALADSQANFQIKSKGDLNIINPPQVFIDGTSYVRAKNLDTGPAGRTLVYKFPMEEDANTSINELIKQAYANGINDLLRDESVLQYLVNCMITAYRTCLNFDKTNYDRLWNLNLNLGDRSKDLQALPTFAQSWRKEMGNSQGGDIQSWFEYDFMPYLSKDNEHPSKMHDQLAYGFYSDDYAIKYNRTDPNGQFRLVPNSFNKQFTKLLAQYNFKKQSVREANGRITRQSNRSLSEINFNTKDFEKDGHEIPFEYSDENINNKDRKTMRSYPLGQKVTGWYKLFYDNK